VKRTFVRLLTGRREASAPKGTPPSGQINSGQFFSSSSMLDRLPQRLVQTGSCLAPAPDRVGTVARERSRRNSHAVEFSKTEPRGRQQKTSDSRQRPSGLNHRVVSGSLEGAPVRRVTGFLCLPVGRLRDSSRTRPRVNQAVFGLHRHSRSRTKRRLPACTRAPARRARGRSRSLTVSPSTFTPPWATSRRASLVESPKCSARSAGR
jgi:hypothetical protein